MEDSCRRDFLRGGACSALGLVMMALGVDGVQALPVFETTAAAAGTERRYPIPPGDSVNIDRTDQVIVTRFQNHVFVFALSCPHQNNAVKWVSKESRFQCTKHDSQYKPDGTYTSGRATRNLDRYLVRREADVVVIDLHHWVQSDADAAAWAAAAVTL